MEELKNKFIEISSEVLTDNGGLASSSLTFREIFNQETLNSHKTKLHAYFETLSDLDEEYAKHLSTSGTINDLLMKNAKVQILSLSRTMLVGAIKNYESSLSEFEGQVKFRLNTTIAVVAIVVSVIGVIA